MTAISITVEAIEAPIEAGVGFDDAPAPADQDGVRRFQRAMEDEDAAAPVGSAASPGQGGPLASMGDAILRQMQEISRNYRESKEKVAISVEEQSMSKGASALTDGKSVFKLLALQMQLAEATLEVDVISKGVSKFVSTVDQLSKLQ